MDDLTGGEGIDVLLAEWADILRHRHGIEKSRTVRFVMEHSPVVDDEEGTGIVRYGIQASDPSTIHQLHEIFVRDADARLVELEAALAKHGVTVRRPL